MYAQIKKREERRGGERPKPALDDELLTSSGEDLPMYFVRPQQLLDIFTHLEESNLFLIQNCQVRAYCRGCGEYATAM